MSVSEQDVERVAELANLELTSGEKAAMLRDLNSVLDYFAQLNELDTTSVAPMEQVAGHLAEGAAQHLRPDEIAPSLSRERVMACAPDTDGIFFRVPKVIER
jgi:aspartyl-tRNA(Asn)/glutamyl-tRNA(Gln) amidotransferase subunit C